MGLLALQVFFEVEVKINIAHEISPEECRDYTPVNVMGQRSILLAARHPESSWLRLLKTQFAPIQDPIHRIRPSS